MCSTANYTYTARDSKGVIVGQAFAEEHISQTLDPKSQENEVDITLLWRGSTPGFPAGAQAVYQTTSGRSAKLLLTPLIQISTGSFTVTSPIGASHLTYTTHVEAPDNTPITYPEYSEPGTVRCDNSTQIPGSGCVNPDFTPTITTMNQLPHVDQHIRDAQAAGQPGMPGLTPITRTNTAQKTLNRKAACSTARMNALPKTDPALNSCDEYPFASTLEGGATASIAWVPLAEQIRVDGSDIDEAQGTLLSTFYRENRVIEGDKFFVQP